MKPDFISFNKIPRYSRECVVTEKIDGTNASITITEDGQFLTGSRNRWITPEQDNYGFSRWAHENKEELLKLGVGSHFGEWWGQGIQRTYGLKEKRFSLFNVERWTAETLPLCVSLVPVIWQGQFQDLDAQVVCDELLAKGSLAAPGFINPEGVIIYHIKGKYLFKKTCKDDEKAKGEV